MESIYSNISDLATLGPSDCRITDYVRLWVSVLPGGYDNRLNEL